MVIEIVISLVAVAALVRGGHAEWKATRRHGQLQTQLDVVINEHRLATLMINKIHAIHSAAFTPADVSEFLAQHDLPKVRLATEVQPGHADGNIRKN